MPEGSNELTNEKEGSTWRWTRKQTKDGCKERKLGPSDGKKDLAVGKNKKLTGRGAPLKLGSLESSHRYSLPTYSFLLPREDLVPAASNAHMISPERVSQVKGES